MAGKESLSLGTNGLQMAFVSFSAAPGMAPHQPVHGRRGRRLPRSTGLHPGSLTINGEAGTHHEAASLPSLRPAE